jgi:polysaccharide export outer membrane protein
MRFGQILFLVMAFASLTPALPAQQVARAVPAQRAESLIGHVLVANDVISVKVFDEADLDTIARISEDGAISMPLIGTVAVQGKTPEQAARVIRDRLAERFLVNPQVTVMVTEATKRLFTVLGQVQRPGTYRFPDRSALNLPQVIGMAGGYTRLADSSRVTVKRIVDRKETVLRLDAKRMARDEDSKAIEILPGDIIMVGERLF